MPVDVQIGSNANELAKKLLKIQKELLPKVKSQAAQRAVTAGAEALAKDGQDALDDPIKAVFDGKKTRNRLGWIYYEWPSKAEIKRAGGDSKSLSYVQLQGKGPKDARDEQQEALHRQIYGTTERQGVTPATPFIIRPSKRLLRERKIKGVPLKLDSFGNLRNYRRNLQKMLAQPEKFFQVKIGEKGGGRRSNGLPLKPGLYMRVLRVRRYKRNKHTKRYGAPYGTGAFADGDKKKATVAIVTILRYSRIRNFKAKWDFKQKTREAMRKEYKEAFIYFLNRAISKEKPASASGQTKAGRL